MKQKSLVVDLVCVFFQNVMVYVPKYVCGGGGQQQIFAHRTSNSFIQLWILEKVNVIFMPHWATSNHKDSHTYIALPSSKARQARQDKKGRRYWMNTECIWAGCESGQVESVLWTWRRFFWGGVLVFSLLILSHLCSVCSSLLVI